MAAKRRSLWWSVHSWAGLKLSVLMSFVLITGTLAVVAHEIDWLANPAMRVAPRAEPYVSWGTLAQAAQAAVPGGRVASLHAPIDPWFAAEALVESGGSRSTRVFVDPYSGEVAGTGGWANAQRFLRQTHRHLMLPTKVGVPIVSALSFLLLASLITGIVTYKKWWRGFLRPPRAGDARRFNGDLHRLAGLWSLWFVALIVVTGLWYLVESLGGGAPRLPQPTAKISQAPTLSGPALDAVVARAQAAYPELEVREVRLPGDGDRGVAVLGQAGAMLVRDRANAVWLDPRDGKVLLVARGEALNTHQRISEMADPLHFGTFGGLTTKLIWLAAGALLSALSVTGVVIYSLRLAKAAREAPAGGWLHAWRGMGWWVYPALGLIALSLALTPSGLAGAG
ncbi:MAG: PepSY domain-containing protein [Phenylobacterium sp.]|nr:PepSY domain-containing protein [Phenylobacterium sp.]